MTPEVVLADRSDAGVTLRGPPTPAQKTGRVRCPEGMALIPEGRYVMGQATSDRVEKVDTPWEIRAFCLDVIEVRVSDVSGFLTTPRRKSDPMMDRGACHSQDAGELPVNCITWSQASAYCETKGKRLPTDAEWEWAARGADHGWRFPWGDEAPWETDEAGSGVCWGQPESGPGCPAGSSTRDVSPHGVRDLYGSVAEWTSSTHPQRATWRRARGACAHCTGHATVTERLTYDEKISWTHLGFRCASSPLTSSAEKRR